MIQPLNIDLLAYQSDLKLKTIDKETHIYDSVRKKYYKLQPEELVRQLCILYLLKERNYSISLMKVEKMIKYENQFRRYDILAITKENTPFLLIECKAPNVPIDQDVLDQISQYNLKLKVPFLLITNGKLSYCFCINRLNTAYDVVDKIPFFKS